MVRQSKSKTRAGMTRRLESERSLIPTSYKYNINTVVRYVGGLHKDYKGCLG
jgi:hypothetical protein